ncbi:hypothetical protein GCM10008107_06760 [Psychrosphaera saromensis]|uniref:Uncharacterized protein n=1 Tax=Psychrosphaera saromensis TaxID=716813 RepID=A0A2S7UXI8_9GAMM|nr:hypothetical protein [Psychrosphaera saromensis]PQJ54415.1 hypothetical protein BTO11_12605 [Psychrosphaera saromensis]GHB60186.1 hypothetical protein GCM10008107_06760 [Psychrosphaera saromensis]GLQ14626.1 hypothetical protein GCM10007917_20810 [Psychrosphaera saromensis]
MKIKQIIEKFVGLSLPLKILISSFVTALGGSTFIGLIAELALYKYAYLNDLRIPFEGVPYLRFNVVFLSLLFFFTAILVFAGVSIIIKFALNVAYTQIKIGQKTSLPEMPFKQYLKVASIAAIYSAVFFGAIIMPFMGWINSLPWYLSNTIPLIPIPITLYFMRKPKHIKYALIGSYLIVISIFIFNLFNAETYSKFMKELKYGGVDVTVHYSCEGKANCVSSGELYLRTSEYVVLKVDGEAIEIPNSSVKKISY